MSADRIDEDSIVVRVVRIDERTERIERLLETKADRREFERARKAGIYIAIILASAVATAMGMPQVATIVTTLLGGSSLP